MYNSDTEILFPFRVAPSLKTLHGEEWRRIVEFVLSDEAAPTDRYAFTLMMVRMCGCVSCNADSFRAMKGCSLCARQMVRRNRNNDKEICEQYNAIKSEVIAYLNR